MSRKSFILTALIINLTICVTLCIVVFTGGNGNNDTGNHSDGTEVIIEEDSGKTTADKSEGVTLPEEADTTEEGSRPQQGDIQGNVTEKETSAKIIESQVATDTQPINYKNRENNEETTSSQETTSGQETSAGNGGYTGTTAVINSSCNIRSGADVGGNVIGTAGAGASYRIEPSKCDSNWVAIYLDDSTLGYISTAFCSIN